MPPFATWSPPYDGPVSEPAGTAGNTRPTISASLDRFRQLRYLHNHWGRSDTWRAYYWYLTFEKSDQVQSLAEQCQDAIRFPYYDLIPPDTLHMTLARIASVDGVSDDQLQAISTAAASACTRVAAFEISVGYLGGVAGGVGFDAHPVDQLQHLRDVLQEVTDIILPPPDHDEAPLHPHVSIAYCNTDGVPAGKAIATVERLSTLPPARTLVAEATMVLLERQVRAYEWQAISRIPLAG